MKQIWILLLLSGICFSSLNAQTPVKKMMLQGFWWDYENDNYPNGWANYLADLAPRMKAMGVDALWIPPTVKNQDFGQKGVGYAPYDHYDLGDKMQKNDATTRIGNKNDLLRMVAILHANGIEVIQDIVPNHLIGAGSDSGGGGQDPVAPTAPCTDAWKNFRYACYETPATDQSASEYLARKGRFPKNHQNFYPISGCNFCNLCDPNSDPICWQGFGPDVAYDDCAFGLSSNATYNPDQSTYSPYGNGGIGASNGYMRKHTREWLVWYKKQMGFDGVRIDAVKHFPASASEDFLYNLQQNAAWANGTDKMLAVGEYVGGTSSLDGWVASVQNRAGTFDFNLRAFDGSGGLYGMIYGNGNFDLGLLPGAQQSTRYIDLGGFRIHRTVPFVNNHDTYRPQKDAITGNITGWNTGDELSPHVDIREPRLGAAYAVMCAVDGNPQIFFEDLFNIANQGQRWSHDPTNTSELPHNQDVANIMLAHGALDFKGGDYKVRSAGNTHYNVVLNSSGDNNDDDHLLIERSGKAIIGVTDAWAQDQESWVDSDFPAGTILEDYSGGITSTTVVQPDQRVNIKTRAVGYPSFAYSTSYANHGMHYHGYSIWAPQGMMLTNANPAIPTTQEWEMENDLGDSHCESLGQGGRTPNNSPNARVVGKIFVAGSTNVAYEVYLGSPGTGLVLEIYDLAGNQLHSVAGSTASLTGTYANPSTRWLVLKVRNVSPSGNGQKCYVKTTYNAPATVSTTAYPSSNTVSIWTSNGGSSDWTDCHNWEEGQAPGCGSSTVVVPHDVAFLPTVPGCFTGNIISAVPLPLELLRFDAVWQGSAVRLDWRTGQEVNVHSFEVERSLDGRSFKKIATVAAQGQAASEQNYFLEDKDVISGNTYYYRLKIKDLDGQSRFSPVRIARSENGWSKPLFSPNPTSGKLSIQFKTPQDGLARMTVFDSTGRVALVQELPFSEGENLVEVDLAGLVEGVYLVEVLVGGVVWRERVVRG